MRQGRVDFYMSKLNNMDSIATYLGSIGFVPKDGFIQCSRRITYKRNTDDDWASVGHFGKNYEATYVKVYTPDSISVSKYKSTKMSDINQWFGQMK